MKNKQQQYHYLSLLSLLHWNIWYVIIIIRITAFVTLFIGPLQYYDSIRSDRMLSNACDKQMSNAHYTDYPW